MTDRFSRTIQFWIITGSLFLTDGLTSRRTPRARDGDHERDGYRDRGDVPGWVMITVMTVT